MVLKSFEEGKNLVAICKQLKINELKEIISQGSIGEYNNEVLREALQNLLKISHKDEEKRIDMLRELLKIPVMQKLVLDDYNILKLEVDKGNYLNVKTLLEIPGVSSQVGSKFYPNRLNMLNLLIELVPEFAINRINTPGFIEKVGSSGDLDTFSALIKSVPEDMILEKTNHMIEMAFASGHPKLDFIKGVLRYPNVAKHVLNTYEGIVDKVERRIKDPKEIIENLRSAAKTQSTQTGNTDLFTENMQKLNMYGTVSAIPFTAIIQKANALLSSKEFKDSVKYSWFSRTNDAEVTRTQQKLAQLSTEYLQLIEDLDNFKEKEKTLNAKAYVKEIQSFINKIKNFQAKLTDSSDNLIKRLRLPKDKEARLGGAIKEATEAKGPQELIRFMESCTNMIKKDLPTSIMLIEDKLQQLGNVPVNPSLKSLGKMTQDHKKTKQEEQRDSVWKKRVSIIFSLSTALTYFFPLAILPLSLVVLASAQNAYIYDSKAKEIQKSLNIIADVEKDIRSANQEFDQRLEETFINVGSSNISDFVSVLQKAVKHLTQTLGAEEIRKVKAAKKPPQ